MVLLLRACLSQIPSTRTPMSKIGSPPVAGATALPFQANTKAQGARQELEKAARKQKRYAGRSVGKETTPPEKGLAVDSTASRMEALSA